MTLKDQILELRSAGYSYNAIVEELGCAKSTVAYYCGEEQPEKHLRRQRYRRSTKRQIIEAFKTGKSCMDCGVEYPPYVMDFDHRPEETKLFNIGMHGPGFTVDDLHKEIAKCDLVCANCHRERTWQRSWKS